MFCPHCGNQVDDSTRFCPSCGAPLTQDAQQNNQQYANQQYANQQYTNQQYSNPQGGTQQPAGTYRASIQNRSIAMCIILSIVTCGIYGIYWIVCLVNDLNSASNNPQDTSGGMVFLLSLVTCDIYLMYWMYKAGDKVNYIRQRNGDYSDKNSGLTYLLLTIFGLGIVAECLIQNELNKVSGARTE